MEPGKTTTPWVIQFNLVDGRCRVVEEKSANKAVADRYQFGVALERATLEFQQLLQTCDKGKLNDVPKDVKDLVILCRSYRLESLGHNYRCLRLVEYILHLHSAHRALGLLEPLPPVPAEIMWYLNTEGVRR